MDAPKLTIARARRLRRGMTLPEVLLWTALRDRRLGDIRFRRQHPIGPYILDFYCVAARLAVEIDGAVHEHPDAIAHDRRRTMWLNRQAVTVLRFPARDVLENMEAVLAGIRNRIQG